MADALCGPSNALQTFKSHTSVDRSLQQERLGFRRPPNQGFRSSPGPSASNLDAEFEAFQSDSTLSGVQSPAQHGFLPPFAHLPQQQQLPSWASDFQQLNIDGPQLPFKSPAHAHESPFQRSSPTAGWHQEFMHQRTQQATPQSSQGTAFPGTHSQLAMHQFNPMNTSAAYTQPFTHQEQQDLHSREELFDEAAFARAFDEAQAQSTREALKGKERAGEGQPLTFDMGNACTDPGDITGEFDFSSFQDQLYEEQDVVEELRAMRRDGGWEAVGAFEHAHEQEIQHSNSQRSRDIVEAIRSLRAEEEALVRETEPDAEAAKIGADTIPAQAEQENLGPDAQADELSRTAGQLLDNLREEQSMKFQQSSFMELMRQLRDKEVRVEGDKMVSIAQAPHPGGKYYPYDAFYPYDTFSEQDRTP